MGERDEGESWALRATELVDRLMPDEGANVVLLDDMATDDDERLSLPGHYPTVAEAERAAEVERARIARESSYNVVHVYAGRTRRNSAN